ncbi:MAG: NAD(P)/FAD-dependent oxidoreductase [Saprospiraceae bacterium]|nr:NAD(P)/FAD-dependent oxidoreductase [Saprospiraceae bacterium]
MIDQCPYSTVCLPATKFPRIVVVGAGFAGINLIKKLRNKPVQVVLLDRNNFHQFQPLLYQVAIAGLEPDSIVSPIRKLFQGYKNLVYRMAAVERIDPENRRVITEIGWIRYDYLALASGSATNFYGLQQVEENSLGLKDIRDALDIRSWVLQNLEAAAISCNREEKDALTNFVIVGGGPAGVELAGALAEFKRYLLHKDYPEIATDWMKIYLIEAVDRLLPMMSAGASAHALRVLKKLEVETLLNTAVEGYDGNVVTLGNGERLPAKMLVWTAGVKGDAPGGLSEEVLVKGNRLKVDGFNRVWGYDNIFAIGDVAAMISDETPKGHPMLAQVAIQQGRLLAENLLHLVKYGKFRKAFHYRDKGSMATIGKRNAVAEIGKSKWKGWLAWFLWSTVHLFSIAGFKNKIMIGINWTMRYFSYEKANRLIIRKFEHKREYGSHRKSNGSAHIHYLDKK